MTRIMQSKFQPLVMLGLMSITAVVTLSISKIALVFGLWLFGYGLWRTITTRNHYGDAHLFSALIVGAEVYFRMSFSGLPWEFGKIATIILLLTGIMVERLQKPKPLIMILYSLLFLPSIFVPEWHSMEQFKHDIMFNFSGEISLIISVIYFYKRPFSRYDFVKIGRMFIYGVILMAITVFLKAPDYGNIHYGGGSNFAASGGFGPNQVAALYGLGIFIVGFFLLQNIRLFVYRWTDILLLIIFSLQGFFTLSRGGLMGAWLALALSVVTLYLFNPKETFRVLKISPFKFIVFFGLIMLVFTQADRISGGAVFKRYFNVDKYGQQIKEDYTTKREDIAETDLSTFKENWLIGVGIGGSVAYREDTIGFGAAHVEFTRILAENGVLGVFVLLIMFGFPLMVFIQNKNARNRMILVGFVSLGLLTMSHNAMRLAMPGFLYGLGFIILIHTRKIESSYDSLYRK